VWGGNERKNHQYITLWSADIQGCASLLDKIRSEVIRKELEISVIQDVRLKYKQNSINHLERMDNTRLPKHALNYRPRGRRDRGRPRKRRQCVDAGTGQTTKSTEEDDDDITAYLIQFVFNCGHNSLFLLEILVLFYYSLLYSDFYSKTNQLHQCIKSIYIGMTLYMFRTVFPSTISSSRLYIQQPNRYCCLFDKCLLLYVQSWTADDGQKDRPKHVECHSKIK